MVFEDELLNLLLKSTNSEDIKAIADGLNLITTLPSAKIQMIYRVSGSLVGVVLKVFFFKYSPYY